MMKIIPILLLVYIAYPLGALTLVLSCHHFVTLSNYSTHKVLLFLIAPRHPVSVYYICRYMPLDAWYEWLLTLATAKSLSYFSSLQPMNYTYSVGRILLQFTVLKEAKKTKQQQQIPAWIGLKRKNKWLILHSRSEPQPWTHSLLSWHYNLPK